MKRFILLHIMHNNESADLVIVADLEASLCLGANENVVEDEPVLVLSIDSALLQLQTDRQIYR